MPYPNYDSQPSRYLEEAAGLLRKAAETNEAKYRDYKGVLNEGRERIAMKFAQLAAIEKGLLPTDLAQDIAEEADR
jgi:hypothetical protein